MSFPQLEIIVVNFHSKNTLRELFISLKNQTMTEFRLSLVNADKSEDLSNLVHEFGDYFNIEVFEVENNGFAFANNVAIKESNLPYICLINPDVVLEDTFLEKLFLGLKDTKADIVSPKILKMNTQNEIDRIYDGYSFSGRALTIGYGEVDEGQYNEPREVFGVSYAACLAKKTFFEEVGLMWESLFMYYEDVEMSIRAQSLGKISYYIPSAVCHHRGSQSSGGKYSPLQVRYTIRNTIWLYRYVLPRKIQVKYFFSHIIWVIVQSGYFTLKGQLIASFIGGMLGIFSSPKTLPKRILNWPIHSEILRKYSLRDARISQKRRKEQRKIKEKYL